MTGEGRGHTEGRILEPQNHTIYLSQNICASLGSVDHYHQVQVAGLSLVAKLLFDMGFPFEHERSHWQIIVNDGRCKTRDELCS